MLSYLRRLLMRSAIWVIGIVIKGIWSDDFFGQLHAEGDWGHSGQVPLGLLWCQCCRHCLVSFLDEMIQGVWREMRICAPSVLLWEQQACSEWSTWYKRLVASLQKVVCLQSARRWLCWRDRAPAYWFGGANPFCHLWGKMAELFLKFLLVHQLKNCLKMNLN